MRFRYIVFIYATVYSVYWAASAQWPGSIAVPSLTIRGRYCHKTHSDWCNRCQKSDCIFSKTIITCKSVRGGLTFSCQFILPSVDRHLHHPSSFTPPSSPPNCTPLLFLSPLFPSSSSSLWGAYQAISHLLSGGGLLGPVRGSHSLMFYGTETLQCCSTRVIGMGEEEEEGAQWLRPTLCAIPSSADLRWMRVPALG